MICVPIVAKNTEEALAKIDQANALADIMEFRLDLMDSFETRVMIAAAAKPIIVTYRSQKEGGQGSAPYDTRVHYLREALEMGVDFVDVEHSLPPEFREKVFQMQDPAKIILSAHLLTGTPSEEDLRALFKTMAAAGPGIVKIVTRAGTAEDNLRVLSLIPFAKKWKTEMIAFCMGPVGRISRMASCVLGGFLTFASLEAGQESADGQIPILEMKKILELLTS